MTFPRRTYLARDGITTPRLVRGVAKSDPYGMSVYYAGSSSRNAFAARKSGVVSGGENPHANGGERHSEMCPGGLTADLAGP